MTIYAHEDQYRDIFGQKGRRGQSNVAALPRHDYNSIKVLGDCTGET